MNIHVSRRIRPRTTFRWTEEAIATAAKMWAEGHTSTTIGARLGVSRSSVRALAFMHRDRFPSRPKKVRGANASSAWLREASALWREGKTGNTIAKLTCVCKSVAYDRIRAHPDLFPGRGGEEQKVAPEIHARPSTPRSYIGNGRWVDRVPHKTLSGAVVTLARVSMIDERKGG